MDYDSEDQHGTESSDLTSVFYHLSQVGGWMGGHTGDIPYTFTPGKSVLLIFEGPADPSFEGTNLPDTIFRATYFTICYWKNNSKQKIAVKIPAAGGGYNMKIFMSEW